MSRSARLETGAPNMWEKTMSNRKLKEPGLQDVMPETATRLVVMFYDGAIASLQSAIKAIAENDIEGRCHSVNMTLDILAHLSDALDTERGGEIAENLSRLYAFMISRLSRVTLANDPEPARETIQLREILYQAWCEIDRRVTAEAMAPVAEMIPQAKIAGIGG